MTEPRILHLGQVMVDLSMDIDHLPECGRDIFARRSAIQVGGGHNMIHAVRQMGVIGTGPMADMARGALTALHVPAEGPHWMTVIPDTRQP